MQDLLFLWYSWYFIEFLKGVSPFLDRLPAKDREPYMDDLMQKMFKRCIRPNGNGDKDTVIVPYNDIMIYAKKKGMGKMASSHG